MISLLLALMVALTPTGVPQQGVASWYDATYHPRGKQTTWYTRKGYTLYAAVGSWRWGDTPYRLRVCRQDQPARCVVVFVVDHCARCAADLGGKWESKSRAIDLSPAAFAQLAPLGHGLVLVKLTVVLSATHSLEILGRPYKLGQNGLQ